MEYINMPLRGFRSNEYIEATIKQRGIWISLLAWCHQQRNGGIIEGCRSWGDRRRGGEPLRVVYLGWR